MKPRYTEIYLNNRYVVEKYTCPMVECVIAWYSLHVSRLCLLDPDEILFMKSSFRAPVIAGILSIVIRISFLFYVDPPRGFSRTCNRSRKRRIGMRGSVAEIFIRWRILSGNFRWLPTNFTCRLRLDLCEIFDHCVLEILFDCGISLGDELEFISSLVEAWNLW